MLPFVRKHPITLFADFDFQLRIVVQTLEPSIRKTASICPPGYCVACGESCRGELGCGTDPAVLGPPDFFGSDFPIVIVTPLTTSHRGLDLHVEVPASRHRGLRETITPLDCAPIDSLGRAAEPHPARERLRQRNHDRKPAQLTGRDGCAAPIQKAKPPSIGSQYQSPLSVTTRRSDGNSPRGCSPE